MCKIIQSSKNIDDLSIGFLYSPVERVNELGDNRWAHTILKFYVQFFLKDVLEFADHQENATYELD